DRMVVRGARLLGNPDPFRAERRPLALLAGTIRRPGGLHTDPVADARQQHGQARGAEPESRANGNRAGHHPSSWCSKTTKPVRPPIATGNHAAAIGCISSALLKSSVIFEST